MGNSTQFLQLKKNARGIQETEGESTDEDRRERPTNQPTHHSAWALFGTLFE